MKSVLPVGSAARVAIGVATAAALHLSCGGGSSATTPTVPTTPSTTLAAAPTPPTLSSSCPLGQGTYDFECERTTSRLLPQVEAAIDKLIDEKPELFDLESEYAPGTRAYRVPDKDRYIDALVAKLSSMGLCAERDTYESSHEMIAVKDSQAFSEEIDTLLSSGHVRRGPGAYRITCSPAAFPVPIPDDIPPADLDCNRPFPPPIAEMSCKEHLKMDDHIVLDSTPIVKNYAYCTEVGFQDRAECPVRAEGASDRIACENWRVGKSRATGKYGPTWMRTDGTLCTGRETGCEVSPDSAYQLWVYTGGDFRVCAQTGNCCDVTAVQR